MGHHLAMNMYLEAANLYFDAADRLSHSRGDLVNRCLILCTACRLLAGDEDKARASWKQALKNNEMLPSGKKVKVWDKDSGTTYVLCSLSLLGSSPDVPSISFDEVDSSTQWKDALSEVKESNPNLVSWLEAVQNVVEKKDYAKFCTLSEGVPFSYVDKLLFTHIVSRLPSTVSP